MPVNVVHSQHDEKLWADAKRAAQAKGGKLSYALVMHIFQNMKAVAQADRLPGGLADKKKPEDFDSKELASGAKHEQEHTNDPAIAREIAMDHLTEDPHYYSQHKTEKAANPVTREDVSPVGANPNDKLDRRASTEDRKRPRFVIGSKPSPIGNNEDLTTKSEHPDDHRDRNAKPENRTARRDYMKTPEGRAANRKAQENYRSAHPERVAAQQEARAEHGESKGSGHKCASCGKPAMHKHHSEGYGAGDGGTIRWLCHEHHVKTHHPKSNLGEKSMNKTFSIKSTLKAQETLSKNLSDYGDRWYESFRGTPFFKEAVKLEQEHMLHEVDRKQREKTREEARRDRERAEAKEDDVWAWDRKWYAAHDAKMADLKRRYLDHVAEEAGADNGLGPIPPLKRSSDEHGSSTSHSVSVTKAASKVPSKPDPTLAHKTPPKEHREAGATESSDYADPKGHRYPIHDEAHVRSAVSYFNMPRNFGQYGAGERAVVWGRIKAAAKKFGVEVSSPSTPGEKKEKSMSSVFEQIMKGAILKGGDEDADHEAAERMGAVELKREIAKSEMVYAKSMLRAANAESILADLKKGMPPWLKDKKKDDGDADDKDGGNDHDADDAAKDAAKKAKGEGASAGLSGRKPDGADAEADDEPGEKSLEAIGKTSGEQGLLKAMQDAFVKATEARARVRELAKALSTIEHGEAGGAGASRIGSSQTSLELGSTSVGEANGEPFASDSMTGMPSTDSGQAVMLSEDDRDVGAQMSDGQGSLERTMTHGSAELVSSVNQVMGGDASSGGGMAKGGAPLRGGAFGGQAQQSVSAARAAHAARAGGIGLGADLGQPLGYGIPAPARAATERNRGLEWRQGHVHYSTSEDVRVSGLMKSEGEGRSIYGGAQGEPTIDVRAPLLKSMTCGLCKSRVPVMFAKCPSCGNDHASGQVSRATSSLHLSKSVKQSLQAPIHEAVHLPDGVLVIPND